MYEKLFDLNILHEAFLKSKKGVSWKTSIQKYELNELQNLKHLRDSLINNTYRQDPFFEFDIMERGKERHIKSLKVKDRVLQRALCDNILLPIVIKKIIYDNGASVKGKGIKFTRKRVQAHLEKFYRKNGKNGYILQMDFSKFFDNINHAKAVEMFERIIDDDQVINLINYLMKTFGEKGVGIGAQISQLIGIYYPTVIDKYCKIVRGCKFYGRYMDDIYVIHKDKAFLINLLNEIKDICSNFGILINKKKTQIKKLSQGFGFLKVRYFYGTNGKIIKRPFNDNFVRERRKLKKFKILLNENKITKSEIVDQYKSWRGNLIKFNSYIKLKNCDKLYIELFGDKYVYKRRRKRNNGY